MARPRNYNKRRTPRRAVTDLFPEHVKWYAGEIRFLQRPTRRQVRMVAKAIGDWAAGPVGVDGAMLHVGKWPEDIYEGPFFLAGLERTKLPMRYRIAPRGRDCGGGCWGTAPCEIGDCAACDPEWRDEDWREVGA
jgi:hypothetical protein